VPFDKLRASLRANFTIGSLFQGEFGGEPDAGSVEGGGLWFFHKDVLGENVLDGFGLESMEKEVEAGGKTIWSVDDEQGLAPFVF